MVQGCKIHPITDEPIHRTIPLLVARLIRHDSEIEEIHDHQREISVARIESDEQKIETLRARSVWAEVQVAVLQGLLRIARGRIVDLQI
ncbi:hypothetical protein Tco_0793945 [Tanacetum coccineum]